MQQPINKSSIFQLNKWKGLAVCVLIATIVLFVFYGKLLQSPNNTYFSANGDGFQAYYGTLYHVHHDKDYFRSYSMNYPYGEMVFFTGNQPLLANIIKAFSDMGINLKDYTVAIINLLLLLSILLAAVFIYLVLIELQLPVLYSVFAAVTITYLSPQLDRFGGHFSLSYVCIIPLMLYLLVLFKKSRSLLHSIFIGLTLFFAAATHFYLLAFCFLLLLFFWAVMIYSEKKQFGKFQFILLHIAIQFFIPFFIIQLLVMIYDPVTDRTSYPWGFLNYRAYLESVFLPIGKPYGIWLNKIMTFPDIDWEGYAYVGLVAGIGFIVFVIHLFKRIFKKQIFDILVVTDNKLLNIFFWASFAGLLYSFGLPFILGMEWMLDYLGPIRQMRGIARFSWVFFYVMNMVSLYWLWQWYSKHKNSKWKIAVHGFLGLVLAFLLYDAYLNVRHKVDYLNNRIEVLADRTNSTEANHWVKNIKPDYFQAIIPIPYFHIGSENLWLQPEGDVMKNTYIAALKTGLPTTGVLLSRTSLKQSYDNIAMMIEPYRPLDVLKKFKTKKPFLLLVNKGYAYSVYEQQLINQATLIDSTTTLSFYELPFSVIEHGTDSLYHRVKREINNLELIRHNIAFSTDTTCRFVYDDFYGNLSNNAYMGVDAYEGVIRDWNVIYNGAIPNYVDTTYLASFWFGDFNKDRYPRTTIEILLCDSSGTMYKSDYPAFHKLLKIIDNDWALLEYAFKFERPNDKIKITLWNHDLGSKKLTIDELLIRPVSSDVYVKTPDYYGKNNRFYKIIQ